MNAFRHFLQQIRRAGLRRRACVKVVSMGRERTFHAWDVGDDTFILEDGIATRLGERPSVLIVEKSVLRGRAKGHVLTISTGNHAVAAFPLLDGRFWKLSRLKADRRGDVLMHAILCANVVDGKLEISQRDVSARQLFAADSWLLMSGLGLADIVMLERNDAVLAHYRTCGQEWRVKPLVWTEREMKVALAASRRRIASALSYYHSSCGVHFLSFAEFRRFAALASTDPQTFVTGLRELVSVSEGSRFSFTRLVKRRGHHEIEFFGTRRGSAHERLIPHLERLMESVVLDRARPEDLVRGAAEAVSLFETLLTHPDLADEATTTFVETLYKYVTGEIYALEGEGSVPAFDDRRTALPGATYVDGRPVMHPGADARTEVLMSNLRGLMSKDEIIEYANVYELRTASDETRVGCAPTREIVYKTNRRPLENALVEKRLSRRERDYGAYLLARIGALRGLGVSLSDYYRLLKRRAQTTKRPYDFYIRRRCEGDPMEAIPAGYFCSTDDASVEEKEVVLMLAGLMGDAAAQNMAMKKYDPETNSPLFGVGKEIYEFGYEIARERVIPQRVSTCSVRGSFGWPNLAHDEANLAALGNF